MGGTEKAAYLFAIELHKRGHEVTALTNSKNCRIDDLVRAGVKTADVPNERGALKNYFTGSGCEIIHHHASGYSDHRQLYGALDDLGQARPKVIETNVFGRLMDPYDKGHVQMRMFMSMASGAQAFTRPQMIRQQPDSGKHTVLYNPLPPYENQAAGIRPSLGLEESDFVMVRVGRPGHKWATWECEAFKVAKKENPRLRMILMEPNSNIKQKVRSGFYGEGIVLLDATSDTSYLNAIYASSDIMLHASSFGESYGYTLAEGMQCGLPIITRTTPWADNAQVELVKNGETGFVCCSVAGMTQSILELANDTALRARMSSAAKARIVRFSNLQPETDLLEAVCDLVLRGTSSEVLKNRYQKWREYSDRDFPKAEWDVREKNSNQHLTYFLSRIYSFYRMKKVLIGSRYWRLRSKFGY